MHWYSLPLTPLQNTLVIDTPRVRKQTRQYSTLRGEGGELSEPDSDDEYPPANSRQSRSSRRSERHTGNGYGRTDCFRVEKHLLVYGWVNAARKQAFQAMRQFQAEETWFLI